jgi:hypothetical protein
MLTREFGPQGWYTTNASFAAYGSPFESSAAWWKLLQSPRYRDVLAAKDLDEAIGAIGKSGYATDPGYGGKLQSIRAGTVEQQDFLDDRQAELMALGVPEHLAELGARQSALETGWGQHLAGGSNYYGIKLARNDATRSDAPVQPIRTIESPQPAVMPVEMQTMDNFAPPQGYWDKVLSDPVFQLGAGILARAGGPAGDLGQGVMLGMAGYRQDRRDAEAQHYRALALQERQRKAQAEQMQQAQLEEFIRSLPPEYQAAARIDPRPFIEAMFASPDGPKPTDDMREYAMAQQQGFDGSFLDYLQTVKRAGAAQVNVGLGSTPAGYERFEGPAGAALRPLPGHPELIQAEEKLGTAAQAVRDFDAMINMIESYGSTELVGTAAGEMSALYGQLTAHVAKMRDLGVLQEGERQAIEAKMPDPTSLGSLVSPKSSALGNYRMSRRLLEAKLRQLQRAYSGWGLGPQPEPTPPDYLVPTR